LEEAQDTADSDSSTSELDTGEEPVLVEQLAGWSARGWCNTATPLDRTWLVQQSIRIWKRSQARWHVVSSL